MKTDDQEIGTNIPVPASDGGREFLMPKFSQDELSRLDDIEALMTTARDLAARFRGVEIHQTEGSIQAAISSIRIARSQIIDRLRTP